MNIDDYNIIKPGHIVEYFPLTQTATVKIANSRTYSTSSADDLTVAPGLLYDVPTFTPGGGNYHITFPIKAGDTCLLTFSQFGYDHWFVKNEDAAGIRSDGHPQPWTYRKFDLADGFCQVGWNNLKTSIENYSPLSSEWRNEDRLQRIVLKEDGIIEITTNTNSTWSSLVLGNDGRIVLESDNKVIINSPKVSITASTSLEIDSPTVTMSGTLDVVGKVTGGSGEFDGISSEGHTHTGDSGGTTSPPN